MLNKININKDEFSKEFNVNNTSRNHFNTLISFNSKNIDFKKKLKLVFKENRKTLKFFFNLKYYRQFSFSKNIKKINNLKKSDFIFNYESTLVNIIMKSDFFFSKSDCIWFIENGLISVNSFLIKNSKLILKPYDIINIVNGNYYFEFYKKLFDNLLNNLYKIGIKLWSINKNRYKNLNQKGLKENYPK